MSTQSTVTQVFKAVFPQDGAPLTMMSETIHIRLRGEDTGGAYSVIEDETPPQAGPPLHVHSREDETFYVVEGEYEIQIGEAIVRATPGSYLYAPRDVPHRFRNISEQTGRLLIVFSPPGFEHFFEEVDAMASAGPPAFEQVVKLAASYGNQALSSALTGDH